MDLTVTSHSKSLKSDSYDHITSIDQFLAQVSKKNRGISKNRIRITNTVTSKPITTTDELIATPEITIKDLGPQLSWRLVFLIEYFGPLLIHYVTYNYVFGAPKKHELIYKLNIIHYVKREFESIFVHKFSNATMPLFSLFKNCFHYWILGSSLSLIYGDYLNFDIPNWNPNKKYVLYFWIFCEFFNFISHIQLRLLGDKSIRAGKGRQEPKGGFFELFIAPNYTFEIYGWIAVFLLSPNPLTLTFIIVGAVQMYLWAKKKAANYHSKKAFLIPFLF